MVLKKFWEYIEKSLFSGVSKKVSTTRISSYLILGSILTTTLIYLLIDIINAFIKWKNNEVFIVSTESLVFFGMILTHHLALLGINKNAETKQYVDFIKAQKGELKKDSTTTKEPTNTEDITNTEETAPSENKEEGMI